MSNMATRRSTMRTGTLINARTSGPTTRQLKGDFDPATLLTPRRKTVAR